MSDVTKTARAVSYISVANAVHIVSESIRACCGNDSTDPDVNRKAFPVGLEEAVAARINSRLAVKTPAKAPIAVVEGN